MIIKILYYGQRLPVIICHVLKAAKTNIQNCHLVYFALTGKNKENKKYNVLC